MAPTLHATRATTLSDDENAGNGTLHVTVTRAINLPTLDFGKRQEPYVQVSLEGSVPKSWGTTDPSFHGFPNSEWTNDQNREIELFYDANLHAKDAILTFEVYSNESNEDLIGIGQIDVFSVAQNKTTVEKEITVRLKEALNSTISRGELVVTVCFGPPVRKAFRAAQRVGKLLDARDSVVASLWSMGLHAAAPLSKYLQGPTDYLKKNRKLSMVLAATVGILSAGLAVMFMMIAVPTATIAAFTFPFWIIPFLIVAFFTAPLWLPIVILVGLFLTFIVAVFVGLGVTSRPVRRKGAQLSSRIKHTDVGKRVVYEKST